MATFVTLFRAINVGGNNPVKMPVLKEMHEALGFKKVSSYLQTGNLVFESTETDLIQLANQIKKEFEKTFGFSTEVLVRSAAELKELFKKNPFLERPEKETKWIIVIFLSASADEQGKAALLKAHAGPEEIFIADKELYIYYPEGIGRSKLSNTFIEKNLKVSGTGRNWNTVTKLLEMTKQEVTDCPTPDKA